uniref:NADH-ubiquinone oxidoreductase chain 6 n=1 Tax=Aspasma minima TaxID=181476 RepID=Q8HKQ0_ASPMI|nr:NADH dehydrogenase subunit 6 [Aspasma minima]BAC23798.1 NADH dehydrogenase subunit 6 [Aspasma minima]
MNYIFLVPIGALVIGLVGVASVPSPYFGALGLVLAAGGSCGVLLSQGGTFLSLILFLIYLGGMLVVFAYTAAIAADPYPEAWGSLSVCCLGGGYMMGIWVGFMVFKEQWGHAWWTILGESGNLFMSCGDTVGTVPLYSSGGAVLATAGYVLLLTLTVILVLVRGQEKGGIRMI